MDSFFAIERLSAFLDEELPPAEMTAVRTAIAENPEVREAYEALKRNRQWIAEHIDTAPPDTLRERVFAELSALESVKEHERSFWSSLGISWSTLRIGFATASVALLAYIIIVPDATLLLYQAEQTAEFARAPAPETDAHGLTKEPQRATESPAMAQVDRSLKEATESETLPTPSAEIATESQPVPPPQRQQTVSAPNAAPTGVVANAVNAKGDAGSADQLSGIEPQAAAQRTAMSATRGAKRATANDALSGGSGSAAAISFAADEAPPPLPFEEPPESKSMALGFASDEDSTDAMATARATSGSADSTGATRQAMPVLKVVTYRVYTTDINAVLQLRDTVEGVGSQLRSVGGGSFTSRTLSSEDNFVRIQTHLPTNQVQTVLNQLEALGATTRVSGEYGGAEEVQLRIEMYYQP